MRIIQIFLIFIALSSCRQIEKKQENNTAPFKNIGLFTYSKTQLEADFNLLTNSLKEAHTGLYWYSSEKQFDSIVSSQRSLLKDSLNGLEFYNIVAPIVAFTKEDHCDISLSGEITEALSQKGLYLPLTVVNLKNRAFLLNNPIAETNIKGFELLAINRIEIRDIYSRIFNSFAADGFITSSKYRYLDFNGFSREYAKVIGQQEENLITVFNLETGKKEHYNLKSVKKEVLSATYKKVKKENKIRTEIEKPAQLEFADNNTAILTFRTFADSYYEEFEMNFKQFTEASFTTIASARSKSLIIDIRDNGGGNEGNEDYVFSYLTNKPYKKYKYVQASGLTFSFLNYTDYSAYKDRMALEKELKEENQKLPDSKYYRKPTIYIPEPLKKNPFKGSVYVLTSGWTYSGGAEFSTLMKEHTSAVFIGEETGGGYYGNTSGTSLALTLPNTKLAVEIPILKFALDVKKGKMGRGVIPDHEVQPSFNEFVNGYDTEMEHAKRLIQNKNPLK